MTSEPKKRLRIILVEPRNPLNIGAAARAMYNFGFQDLWLIDPWDQAFREAKSAMGAAEVLRHARVIVNQPHHGNGMPLPVRYVSGGLSYFDIPFRLSNTASPIVRRACVQWNPAARIVGTHKRALISQPFCALAGLRVHLERVVRVPIQSLGHTPE